MLSLHSKSDMQPASAVASIVCVVRHVEIMLDLHPTPTPDALRLVLFEKRSLAFSHSFWSSGLATG